MIGPAIIQPPKQPKLRIPAEKDNKNESLRFLLFLSYAMSNKSKISEFIYLATSSRVPYYLV